MPIEALVTSCASLTAWCFTHRGALLHFRLHEDLSSFQQQHPAAFVVSQAYQVANSRQAQERQARRMAGWLAYAFRTGSISH